MWMLRITDRADRVTSLRPGYRQLDCPACQTACVAPDDVPLVDVGCAACLAPLARPPHGRRAQAVRRLAEWADKRAAPGPGHGVVACPHCGLACLVAVGLGLAATGCVGCLALLGDGPLVRHDLAAFERDPWEDVRLVPCLAVGDLASLVL